MKNKRYSCHPGNNKGFWSSVPGTRPGDKAKCIFYYTAGQGWWQGIEGHLRSTTLCRNRLKLACYLTQNDGILSGRFPITYLENAAAVHPHSHKSRLPASHTDGFIWKSCSIGVCVVGGGDGEGQWQDRPQCWTRAPIQGAFGSRFPGPLHPAAHKALLSWTWLSSSCPSSPSFSSPTHDSDLGFAYLFSFAHRLVPGARFLVLPTQSSYSGPFFFPFFFFAIQSC